MKISHYRKISKKYKRAKTIINAFAATTGNPDSRVVNSKSCDSIEWNWEQSLAPPIAGIAALLGTFSTAASASSGRLNKQVTKHEKDDFSG